MREDGYERIGPLAAYRLRLRRKRLLWRAWRARRDLTPVIDRTAAMGPDTIPCFATIRNEAARLPYWLEHHRALGVGHFLVVDNGSDDGGAELLADQPDVSLWRTGAGYKAARFGMDWLTWLQGRHGAGRWCLVLDADELLVIPFHGAAGLRGLCAHLDGAGAESFGALMLDIYPEGPLGAAPYRPGDDPTGLLCGFDPDGYWWRAQGRYGNISIRGGARERAFFADRPEHGPHLHKIPLVKWRRGHAWVSSTHIALPRALNRAFDARDARPTGVLLHTKFLPDVLARSAQEKHRAEHFTHPERYGSYYDRLTQGPVLWHDGSARLESWQQLEALGLMTRGRWREGATGGGKPA